jgi:SAM-dependent methyltransferase
LASEGIIDDPAFREVVRRECRSSARQIVPLLIDGAWPDKVIDVGCGEGWFANEFNHRGIPASGIDGAPYTSDTALSRSRYIQLDLTEGFSQKKILLPKVDLALCLEVAEHIPEEHAGSLIADLCSLADTVLFSAAIPGQGGYGHVNEQWPHYWVKLFARHGFMCSGALRWQIWNDDKIEPWYKQNMTVATRQPLRFPQWFGTPLAPIWHVVHPAFWESRL